MSCPTGKQAFGTPQAAHAAVSAMRSGRRNGTRAYRCEMCGALHVTSERTVDSHRIQTAKRLQRAG